MLAYRSSVHETTGFTPYYLVYGQEATLPVDLLIENTLDKSSAKNIKKQFTDAARIVHANTNKALNIQKTRDDSR